MSSVLEPLTSYLEVEISSAAAEIKPSLESYDSAEEFTFVRLVRLYELAEIEDQELNRCIFDDQCLHVA